MMAAELAEEFVLKELNGLIFNFTII